MYQKRNENYEKLLCVARRQSRTLNMTLAWKRQTYVNITLFSTRVQTFLLFYKISNYKNSIEFKVTGKFNETKRKESYNF